MAAYDCTDRTCQPRVLNLLTDRFHPSLVQGTLVTTPRLDGNAARGQRSSLSGDAIEAIVPADKLELAEGTPSMSEC